jgi:hypothetical protein
LIVRPNETPEDGKTTRTIEELMDEVIRRGIVPSSGVSFGRTINSHARATISRRCTG